MATHSFPVPTHLNSIFKWFSAQKRLNKATNSSQHIYMLVGSCTGGTISKYENRTRKVARNALNIGEVWTQYVAMVTKLLSSNCGADLVVEFYGKESNNSDTNCLRYHFSSYLIKIIRLSVWLHYLANLHILKTWISLEWKEIFENSKQHFSSYAGYLFMF